MLEVASNDVNAEAGSGAKALLQKVLICELCLSSTLLAQAPASNDQVTDGQMKDLLSIRSADRISAPVFNQQRVVLSGASW